MNSATCSSGNGEYLASTIRDSVIKFDVIINAADNVSTNYYYANKCFEYCFNKF